MEKEQRISVELGKLKQFSGYTFQMHEGTEMEELIESISVVGIVTPIIVRPSENGYEIISGHRRVQAARIIGLTTVPAIIRKVDSDDEIDTRLSFSHTLSFEQAREWRKQCGDYLRNRQWTDIHVEIVIL